MKTATPVNHSQYLAECHLRALANKYVCTDTAKLRKMRADATKVSSTVIVSESTKTVRMRIKL